MGRQSEAIINHFSHPHPLHLTNPHPTQTCSACKQTLNAEPFYTCKLTIYSLHVKCTQLPQRITHPCHHQHPLSLFPKPQTPNGVFACNACGKNGDGFSYSCRDCNLNIHVECATLPLALSHQSHSHPLNLVFFSPYGTNIGFSCDVCSAIGGSMCWLYRCGLCGFDAHLSCATSNVVPVVAGAGRSIAPENVFLNQFNNQRDQYLQAIMGNVSSQIPQAVMGAGAGGGMNNQMMQALMGGGGGGGMNNQMMQALMGGGGGGGMNNQIMQALMGGGGGGGMNNQIMQALMGGGGGGGGSGDLMQSLLGGSNGGVGGLDLSSVLGSGGDLGGLMGAGFGGFGF